MAPIKIMGLDGPSIDGTEWEISEGGRVLERVETRQRAERRARNKWAAPGQAIKLVSTTGRTSMLRQGDSGASSGGGMFGGGSLF